MKTCRECSKSARDREAIDYHGLCGFHVVDLLANDLGDAMFGPAESRVARWERIETLDSDLRECAKAIEREKEILSAEVDEVIDAAERKWQAGHTVGEISEDLDLPLEFIKRMIRTNCGDRITLQSTIETHPDPRRAVLA